MPEPFGTRLRALIEERGMSLREFARLVESDSGFVSRVLAGARRPPLRRIDAWSHALGLSRADTEELSDLAHLAHAPPRVRALVARLREELAEARTPRRKVAERRGGYRER